MKENNRKLLKKILTSENIPWAGYWEGAELTIILSSGGPPEVSTRAIHKAKWMAWNLYSMKMFLYASQHDYSDDATQRLEQLVTFVSLLITPRWITASLAADAQQYNLTMMQNMMKYKEHD